MLNKLFLGYLNNLTTPYLVYFSGFLLMVTVFTTKIVQFAVVLDILTIVLIDENSVQL